MHLCSVLLAVLASDVFAGGKTWRKKERKNRRYCVNRFPDELSWEDDPWLPFENATDNAQRLSIPSLTQDYYNEVLDIRATMSAKDIDLIFSTNGNWQLALTRLLERKYFIENPSVQDSYLITTSPPISVPQMSSGLLKVSNVLWKDAQPHVVAAPGAVMNALDAEGFLQGERIPIIRTYGNVILKRKGDWRIQSFEDLKWIRPGRFASSDPAEGGSYNNYRTSVMNIVLENPSLLGLDAFDDAQTAAEELVFRLFDEEGVATIGGPMHRSVPHMIATGQADAGLIFLHLAIFAMVDNPGVFEIVYLAKDKTGGTDDPAVLALGQDPLDGNRVGTFFVQRTTTAVNAGQNAARENFIADLQSSEFTDILVESGLRRPE